MIYIIKYNGIQFAEVDIPMRELKNYQQTLARNLPKATMEKKKAILTRPQ